MTTDIFRCFNTDKGYDRLRNGELVDVIDKTFVRLTEVHPGTKERLVLEGTHNIGFDPRTHVAVLYGNTIEIKPKEEGDNDHEKSDENRDPPGGLSVQPGGRARG